MYQSSYIGEGNGISVPDGYGGTMLTKEEEPIIAVSEPEEAEPEKESESVGLFGNLFRGGSTGLFGRGGILGDFKLGTEEILILGAALFLILSGSKDIECLIILLVLLFIK